jgi:hypothetical protein
LNIRSAASSDVQPSGAKQEKSSAQTLTQMHFAEHIKPTISTTISSGQIALPSTPSTSFNTSSGDDI